MQEKLIGKMGRPSEPSERVFKRQMISCRRKICIARREAVARSVAAHDTIERVGGYSPAQWALGRAPDWAGDLFTKEADDASLARDSSSSFREGLERQADVCWPDPVAEAKRVGEANAGEANEQESRRLENSKN